MLKQAEGEPKVEGCGGQLAAHPSKDGLSTGPRNRCGEEKGHIPPCGENRCWWKWVLGGSGDTAILTQSSS